MSSQNYSQLDWSNAEECVGRGEGEATASRHIILHSGATIATFWLDDIPPSLLIEEMASRASNVSLLTA